VGCGCGWLGALSVGGRSEKGAWALLLVPAHANNNDAEAEKTTRDQSQTKTQKQ